MSIWEILCTKLVFCPEGQVLDSIHYMNSMDSVVARPLTSSDSRMLQMAH